MLGLNRVSVGQEFNVERCCVKEELGRKHRAAVFSRFFGLIASGKARSTDATMWEDKEVTFNLCQ
jgi:hypothetical protein